MVKRKMFGAIPQEISENIQAPELAPSDKRISGRTKQLNFKVREDFYWKLKNRAVEEKCLMVEILEKSLGSYEREKQTRSEKDLEKYVKIIERKPKSKPKINPYPYTNFTCDNCQSEYEKEMAYSIARNLKELNRYPTYCSDCVVK